MSFSLVSAQATTVERTAGQCTALHEHLRGELAWVASGVHEVRALDRVWVAPGGTGIWIPPRCLHRGVSQSACRESIVLVDRQACAGLPTMCCIVRISNTLLAAIERLGQSELNSPQAQAGIRVLQTLLQPLPIAPLRNPFPERRTRFQPIVQALQNDPADARTLSDWAQLLGSGVRPLGKSFQHELGLSFRSWRRQVRLLASVRGLAQGKGISLLASQLGYASPSAFVAAFHQGLHCTPGAYSRTLRRYASAETPVTTPQSSALDTEVQQQGGIEVGACRHPEGNFVDRHRHNEGELLWSPTGVVTVGTESGLWVAPRNQAVWIPAGIFHEVWMWGQSHLHYAFVEGPSAAPQQPCALNVSPALATALRNLGSHGQRTPFHSPDAGTILDAVQSLRLSPEQGQPLCIPMQPQGILGPIAAALRDDPTVARSLNDWASLVSMSPRSLSRLFLRDTGVTFGHWRRLMRLRRAVEQLTLGEGVTRVSAAVGYRSVSMFVATFRRTFGVTPGRFA